MKKILVIFFVTAAVALFCTQAYVFAETEAVKIGVFDIQKIIRESKSGQQAKAAFEKELAEKQNTLKEKEDAVKTLEDAIKKDTQMTAAKKKEKEEGFAKEVKELKRLRADLEEELKKKDAELASKLIRDILEIARKIGEQEKYTIILQKGMEVVYTDKTTDISQKIMERLDAQSKK